MDPFVLKSTNGRFKSNTTKEKIDLPTRETAKNELELTEAECVLSIESSVEAWRYRQTLPGKKGGFRYNKFWIVQSGDGPLTLKSLGELESWPRGGRIQTPTDSATPSGGPQTGTCPKEFEESCMVVSRVSS